MLCNQAPLSREGANHSIPQPAFSLENFLSQYIQTNDSKFHSIQQTLQKAESHSFTPRAKSDKPLNAKELAFDSNLDSAGVVSGKTSRTLDSSKKTSLNSYNTPTSLTTPDPLADDSGENINANKTNAISRSKAKTLDRKKVEQNQARPGRQSAMPSFWSPYRSKSPSGSNNILSYSFFSDLTNPPKSHLNANNGNDSNSDEEDRGDFLMIKPLTTTVVNPKFNQPLKTQNFNLNLEETLFPREIIEYADSLQEPNLGAYARSLIEFIYSFKDNNHFFSTKRPISEALYSMFFEGETLETFKKLLHQVLEKLKEESITLKQKFRSEIDYIGTKHAKIFKSTVKSIKFEEKELQKLQSKIMSILQERCLMDSQSALSFLHHFLDKILEKFPSILRPNAFKLGKSVIVDHITLPKLLEKFLEYSNSSSSFYKTIVIYTYDLYLTPQNFMLYLIQRYFEPEPLYMTASELRIYRTEVLRHVKVHILKLLTFWVEERRGDFLRSPDITIMLSTFLDLITPLENEKTVVTALSALTAANDYLSRNILKFKQKVCNKVDQHVSPHSLSLHYSSSETSSLVTKVISVSDGLQSPLYKDDMSIMKSNNGTLLKKSPFANAANTATGGFLLSKSESAAALLSKGSDASHNHNNRSHTTVVSQTSSSQMFKFWTSFQCNKGHYDEKMLLEENSEEIAKHLTVIDWRYFSKINISEMIKKRWTKGDKAECPYYFKYVSRFNSFCSWIQYIILSQESFRRRTEIAEKFLEIGVICLRTYNNYSSSHYIFAAVSSLEKFGVISLQEPLSVNYEELKKTFIQQENFLSVYKDIFGAMKSPAIPNLNFFLQSFLKLQDGVVFWIKLPESSKHRYLKFPLLAQIQDSCKEMRRFQKTGYENINFVKSSPLHKFLKTGFKKDVPINLEDKDQALNSLARMVNQVKEKQSKLFNFFGVKANNTKGSVL